MRLKEALVLGAFCVFLASCGNGQPIAQTSPVSAHQGGASASPTPDLKAAAAAAYLQAAPTANAANDQINKGQCGASSWPSAAVATSCWKQYLAVDQTFLNAIYAINYPPEMKSDVDAQISAETKVVSDETTLEADPTNTTAQNSLQTDENAQTAAANIVRHDLGLPQVSLPTPSP